MEVSRGANLVGMSMMPLDVCLRSLLIKKKIIISFNSPPKCFCYYYSYNYMIFHILK